MDSEMFEMEDELETPAGIMLEPAERDLWKKELGIPLLRLWDDSYIVDKREPGDDYCMTCGCIAPKEEFLKNNRCPSCRSRKWDS